MLEALVLQIERSGRSSLLHELPTPGRHLRDGVGRGERLWTSSCAQGIESLRIADASVMPAIPLANTNAPVVMIGEFASRLLVASSCPAASAPSESFHRPRHEAIH
jgi:GMC oxidoreductase